MADRKDYLTFSGHDDLDYTISTDDSELVAPVPERPNRTAQETIFSQEMRRVIDSTNGKVIYNSYAGVDIVAQIVLPNDEAVTLGELQTISYSIHRENAPVRTLGHVSPVGFIKGGRTIAGSMIFTVFNNYAFYRLRQFQTAIKNRIYPVSDMLPPFDLVLTFANESGVFSKMKIYGVTIVDEGGAMSVDDLISESTFTYMARGIQPLTGYRVPGVS